MFANPEMGFQEALKRDGADEARSEWVTFPDGKRYLLPILRRFETVEPTFDENGGVTVKVHSSYPELVKLQDEFINSFATLGGQVTITRNEDGGIVSVSPTVLLLFLQMVRALLAVNYDLKPEQLSKLLTMTHEQSGVLMLTLGKLVLAQ